MGRVLGLSDGVILGREPMVDREVLPSEGRRGNRRVKFRMEGEEDSVRMDAMDFASETSQRESMDCRRSVKDSKSLKSEEIEGNRNVWWAETLPTEQQIDSGDSGLFSKVESMASETLTGNDTDDGMQELKEVSHAWVDEYFRASEGNPGQGKNDPTSKNVVAEIFRRSLRARQKPNIVPDRSSRRSRAQSFLSPLTVSSERDESRASQGMQDTAEEEVEDLSSVPMGPTHLKPRPFENAIDIARRFTRRATAARSPNANIWNGDGMGGDGMIISAKGHHTATVIFLHGIGHSAEYWIDTLDGFGNRHIKYVLPTAPHRQLSAVLVGGRQRAWFDIKGSKKDSPEDRVGILCAVARIVALIREELRRGIPASRIVVAGFSQGGAVALNTILRMEDNLAGALCIGSWLALREDFPKNLRDNKSSSPIVMYHGSKDTRVRAKWAYKSVEYLKAQGVDVTYREFPGLRHDINNELKDAFNIFLAQKLPPETYWIR